MASNLVFEHGIILCESTGSDPLSQQCGVFVMALLRCHSADAASSRVLIAGNRRLSFVPNLFIILYPRLGLCAFLS